MRLLTTRMNNTKDIDDMTKPESIFKSVGEVILFPFRLMWEYMKERYDFINRS